MFLAPATKNILPDDPRPPVLKEERRERRRDLGKCSQVSGEARLESKFPKNAKSYCTSGACFGFQSSHKYKKCNPLTLKPNSFSLSGHSGALGQEALALQRCPTGKHGYLNTETLTRVHEMTDSRG